MLLFSILFCSIFTHWMFRANVFLLIPNVSVVHSKPVVNVLSPLASRVNLRSYMEGGSTEQMECEIRRYSTRGIQALWPSQGAMPYDLWFTCTIKHPEDSFTITGYLRHTPSQPPSSMDDYDSFPPVGDREVITASGNHQPHPCGPPWYDKYQHKNTQPQVR